MRWFRRRRGRHEGRPATLVAEPSPSVVAVRPATVFRSVTADRIPVTGHLARRAAVTLSPPVPTFAVEAPALPRVQLGFRDGTTAQLAPDCAQSLALQELAGALTRRD